jgi:hypothetical protein
MSNSVALHMRNVPLDTAPPGKYPRPRKAIRSGPLGQAKELVELKVEGVALDTGNSPVVVLREVSGKRSIPIWIGQAEAIAITMKLEGHDAPRPLTHDLLNSVLKELGARLTRVVIADARENIYYARLDLLADANEKTIDCRPSDGIALALRAGAPIMISEELLDRIEKERKEREEREGGKVVIDTGETTVH